ncbi:MAG: FapA family protein [Candidatus Cloacimonetes bacterium]|nr:FapA family protein [Candidatus Cloacimonadota bacterium]
MNTEEISLEIEFEEIGKGSAMIIKRMPPILEDDSPVSADLLLELLAKRGVNTGVDEEALRYYVNLAKETGKVWVNLMIAQGEPAIPRGKPVLKINVPVDCEPSNRIRWGFLSNYMASGDFNTEISLLSKSILLHEGQVFATVLPTTEQKMGKTIYGKETSPARVRYHEWEAGENVHYDEKKQIFSAGCCGYLFLRENIVGIKEALVLSENDMKILFINLPRTNPAELPDEKEMESFARKRSLPDDVLLTDELMQLPSFQHIIVASGSLPGESKDAKIKLISSIENTIGVEDEHGKIDWKECEVFHNVSEGEVLAEKQLPQQGKAGINLFGKIISARLPKDVPFTPGGGTRSETDEEAGIMRVYAVEDGILEYKNNILSVFSVMNIRGNVDYSTGHIKTKANVNVQGDIQAGFNVETSRNLIVSGTIEDNCKVKAGGGIQVMGGIIGEETVVECKGDLIAKYVEMCNVKVDGLMTIQRYIRGAKCLIKGNLTVFGHGINLNERGALVDAEIKISGSVFIPVVGSDAGLKSSIWFGHNEALARKIARREKTLKGLHDKIQILNDQFDEVDITASDIYRKMQQIPALTKEKVIQAIQEKNSLDKKITMMQEILDKELAERIKMLESSRVNISKKIIPDLVLHCDDMQLTIDTIEAPSMFYFNLKSRLIERSSYLHTQ